MMSQPSATFIPKLGSDVAIHRHAYRGRMWYIVRDPLTGRSVHLAEGAWRVVGAMDGQRDIGGIARFLQEQGNDVSEQHVRRVCAELVAVGLLQAPDGLPAHADSGVSRWLKSPLSVRVPLVHPGRLLDATMATVQPLFSRPAFFLWLSIVLLAAAQCIAHFDAIAQRLDSTVISPHGVALVLGVYLIMKLIHELAHAYAIRAFGGRVREMGLVFLVFVPVPYVDASAASVFADKRQRMLVSGVGIMAELFLASVACLLWLRVAPGLIREICFTTMMVGGVSTLLFNGNPLLKFDGYFVLADALEIPNLAARARALMTRGAARLFLGLTTGKHDPARGTERAWLIGYGLVSGTYRIAILALIVWFLAREIPVVGYVLATWVVVLQLARPLWRAVRFVAEHAVNAPGRRAVGARFALCISAALLGLFVLPFPAWGSAEGVIWMSHDRHIKAPVDAFVDRALVTGQTRVTRDQVVMQFAAPDLEARARRVAARVDELEARHGRALFHDRSRLGELTHALDQARTELIDLRTDIAALQVAAPADGEVHFVRARSEPGRYVRQGELVGFVRDARPAVARAVVRQGEIQRLRQAGTAVRVRLPGVGSAPVGATLVDAFGAATNQLPSVALGSAGGGRIATDALDEELRRSAEDIFVVDVQLADGAPALAVGTRVYLRFDFPPAPLARQLLDALRRLTLDQKFT